MPKDSIAVINGNEYKYRYNPETKLMDYRGPVGDSPPLTEAKFRELFRGPTEVTINVWGTPETEPPLTLDDLIEQYEYDKDEVEYYRKEIEEVTGQSADNYYIVGIPEVYPHHLIDYYGFEKVTDRHVKQNAKRGTIDVFFVFTPGGPLASGVPLPIVSRKDWEAFAQVMNRQQGRN
jgi:hypothetical protein